MRFQRYIGIALLWVQKMYFPFFSIIGGGIYAIQRWGTAGMLPSWVAHYVNDFLCMPIVLYICQFAVRKLKSDKTLILTILPIVSLTIFYSLYFEAYLPTFNVRYTADIVDVFLYFLGATFFYLIENVREEEKYTQAIHG